jgi:hypothetical protein
MNKELANYELVKIKKLITKLVVVLDVDINDLLEAMTEGIESTEVISNENWDLIMEKFGENETTKTINHPLIRFLIG